MAREFPNVVEIEKKLLSAMMLKNGEIIPIVAEILSAEDFYRTEHRAVFSALLKLSNTGSVDPYLLMEQLRLDNQLERVTRFYVLSLIDMEYTTARAEIYAEEILEKSQLRQLIRIGEELMDRAGSAVESAEDLLASAEQKLLATANRRSRNMETMEPIALRALKNMRMKQEGTLVGIDTGFSALNNKIGGLRNSDLIILAARPSMGKTALAMNIAFEAAKHVETAIFSLEMSKEQLVQRLYSSVSGVDATKIFNGTFNERDWEFIFQASGTLCERKIFIDDTGGLTLMEMRARARQLKREEGLGLIVVDYVQLMQGSKELRGNRVQEVSEISRGLKALAKELDVPIIALSQLSRNVEMRADKKPQLSDLRESGSLEQDADIVMFLYREEYYEPEDESLQGRADLIIAKNRNGAIGTIPLQFEKKCLLFSDFTRFVR